MREIEIKARVDSLSAVIDALKADGLTVTKPVTHHDVVYGPKGVDGADPDNDAPWLRIRGETKDGKTTHCFTLKKSVTNQLDSIEHETIIDDPSELAAIISHLGFTLYSDLTKTRQKVHMGDTELCLDTLDGLGSFVEAERMVGDDDVDYEAVVAELWALLGNYGVSSASEVTEGYDVLMNAHLEKLVQAK